MCLAIFWQVASAQVTTQEMVLLTVKVDNVVTHKGEIMLMVVDADHDFPNPDNAIYKAMVTADKLSEGGFLILLPKGHYALSVVHDLDGDKKLSRNALGVPKEPFGFSNNPRIYFGPPDFEDCLIDLQEPLSITIRLKT